MDQQIQLGNKISKKQTDYLPIKLAFQANIFKYVEKKKRELSVFAAIKAKQTKQSDKHDSNSSNLISTNTDFNFYKTNQKHSIHSDIILSARIKLAERVPSQKKLILKTKTKGHKSTLSDWRVLYQQRDGIAQKHQIKNNSPDKMIATDRLFYPSKKELKQEKFCEKHKVNSNRLKQVCKKQVQKQFVSNQNFFHMYHRSVTPITSDYVEKKRITKYLKQNKQRRQSRNGLRLMNEGIFSNLSRNDVSFIPYKYQRSSLSNCKMYEKIEERLDCQQVKIPEIKYNSASQPKQALQQKMGRCNKTQIQKFVRLPRKKQTKNQQKNRENSQGQNPQQIYLEPSKQLGDKKRINISELFSRTIDNNLTTREQLSGIRLKLFKARQNKIEKGIFNVKNVQSQNKFTNLQFNIHSPQLRKASLNNTKHSKSEWIK